MQVPSQSHHYCWHGNRDFVPSEKKRQFNLHGSGPVYKRVMPYLEQKDCQVHMYFWASLSMWYIGPSVGHDLAADSVRKTMGAMGTILQTPRCFSFGISFRSLGQFRTMTQTRPFFGCHQKSVPKQVWAYAPGKKSDKKSFDRDPPRR